MRFGRRGDSVLQDNREQLFDSLSAYQMTSILEGVAVRGTGALCGL